MRKQRLVSISFLKGPQLDCESEATEQVRLTTTFQTLHPRPHFNNLLDPESVDEVTPHHLNCKYIFTP